MNNKYLDFTGLSTYDQKIKEYIGAHWTPVDKTLTQEDEAADAKKTGEEIESVNNKVDNISEDVEYAIATEGVDRSDVGAFTVKTVSDKLEIYGTPSGTYRVCYLNGQNAIKTSSNSFSKTLDAGTYIIESGSTGYQSNYKFDGTYTTFAAANLLDITDNNNEKVVKTFTSPVMIAFRAAYDVNYGTDENPTYITFSAKKISAIDIITRNATTSVNNKVDNLQKVKEDSVIKSINDTVVEFYDGGDNRPVQKLILDITPTIGGSGTPALNNDCPIYGKSGITVYHKPDAVSEATAITDDWESVAGNIYYGNVDIISGIISSDYYYEVFDGSSDEQWSKSGNYRFNHSSGWVGIVKHNTSSSEKVGGISNKLQEKTPNQTYAGTVGFSIATDGILGISLGTDVSRTVAQFRSYLSSNPIAILVPRSQTVTYHITPIEINTYHGDNIFVIDEITPLTVEYIADNYLARIIPENNPYSRKMNAFVKNALTNGKVVYSTMPRQNSVKNVTEYFPTGTIIKGIGYSSVWRNGTDVYRNLTFETYYSALANPASVLYTKDYTSVGISNAHTWYGGVCSSFVTWIIGYDYYASTDILQNELEPKDMDSLEEIEIGDLLNRVNVSGKDNHIQVITQIYTDIRGRIYSIDISDQVSPFFRTKNILFKDFQRYLDTEGYTIYSNPTGKINKITNVDFADDIIFENGNNTYVDVSETDEMWFYIPDGDTIYIKKNTGDFASYNKSSYGTKTVNGVTVYNLSSIFDGVGSYELTTNIEYKKYCHIEVINVGTVSISNDVMTLSGYTNCTPVRYYVVEINENASGNTYDSSFSPIPEGYHAYYRGRNYPIESDTITLEGLPTWDNGGYKIWLEYETGCGFKQVLSDNVGF